jgi:hypothetical protein
MLEYLESRPVSAGEKLLHMKRRFLKRIALASAGFGPIASFTCAVLQNQGSRNGPRTQDQLHLTAMKYERIKLVTGISGFYYGKAKRR